MARNIDFYKRFIASCYTRRATRTLALPLIREDALFVMTSQEMEVYLSPALNEMLAEGRLKKAKGQDNYQLLSR